MPYYTWKTILTTTNRKTNTMENNINYLIEMGIATEDEITLVCNIVGHTQEALENILYARTGYRSFEQIQEEDE